MLIIHVYMFLLPATTLHVQLDICTCINMSCVCMVMCTEAGVGNRGQGCQDVQR